MKLKGRGQTDCLSNGGHLDSFDVLGRTSTLGHQLGQHTLRTALPKHHHTHKMDKLMNMGKEMLQQQLSGQGQNQDQGTQGSFDE